MTSKHGTNSQTVRQRRAAKYRPPDHIGTFPQRVPLVKDAADWEPLLARLEDGEHRASLVTQLGKNLLAFFSSLTPEHFRRFARMLVSIVEDKKTAPRVRIRAVQAAVKPLVEAIELLERLEGTQRVELVQHLESCLLSFTAEFTCSDMERLANHLVELAELPGPKTGSTRIRAVQTTLKLVTQAADALGRLREMHARSVDASLDPGVQERVRRAKRRLKEIEAEVLGQLPSPETSP